MSALLITFGNSFALIILGRVFHDVAAIFRSASVVALENNLEVAGKRGDFITVRNRANTVYAVITMLISFVASLMFNLNNYLPMIGCITTCVTGFILTLFMKDCSDYDKMPIKKEGGKGKLHYSEFIIFVLLVYGLFYPIVTAGQTEGKLFIQQHLLLDFSVEETSLVIGVVICISRIVRDLSNLGFVRLYKKTREKVGTILAVLLCTSVGFLLFGSFIPAVAVKITVMSIGYTIILFIRDPFKLFIQDVIFDNTEKEYHQTLLTMLEFAVKIGTAVTSLGFSLILISCPMTVVMIVLFAIAVIEILISIKLYKLIMTKRGM